jgi:hypothetical protein
MWDEFRLIAFERGVTITPGLPIEFFPALQSMFYTSLKATF